MLFTKEDRKDLEFVKEGIKLLLRCDTYNISKEELKVIKNMDLSPNTITKEEIKVSGNMDLSSVAEEEDDEIREQIAGQFAKRGSNSSFYPEEDLNARQLEVME